MGGGMGAQALRASEAAPESVRRVQEMSLDDLRGLESRLEGIVGILSGQAVAQPGTDQKTPVQSVLSQAVAVRNITQRLSTLVLAIEQAI